MVNGSRARDRARVSVCAIALASVLLRENHLSFTISLDHPKAEGVILKQGLERTVEQFQQFTAGGTNRSSRSNSEQLNS